jgi:hypothetical protein
MTKYSEQYEYSQSAMLQVAVLQQDALCFGTVYL